MCHRYHATSVVLLQLAAKGQLFPCHCCCCCCCLFRVVVCPFQQSIEVGLYFFYQALLSLENLFLKQPEKKTQHKNRQRQQSHTPVQPRSPTHLRFKTFQPTSSPFSVSYAVPAPPPVPSCNTRSEAEHIRARGNSRARVYGEDSKEKFNGATLPSFR